MTAGDTVAPEDWRPWVSASRTRNYLLGDPILDWLDEYGEAKGFIRDDRQAGFSTETDLVTFLLQQGAAFEAGVMRLVAERLPVRVIATGSGDARDAGKLAATLAAMREGVAVIAQGVVWDRALRTYGLPDLLIRSDKINELVPASIAPAEERIAARQLGGAMWHYRVVDVKFRALRLNGGGAVWLRDVLPYAAQLWIYAEGLGQLQGLVPPVSYLLGRSSSPAPERGGCFDRLGRVDHASVVDQITGETLADRARRAVEWVRRLRADGASWDVLPEPSAQELYPNMRADRDAPWRGAKRAIGVQLEELTRLPGMGAARRRAAHGHGFRRWSGPGVSAASLEVLEKQAGQCDGVLDANRAPSPTVLPARIPGDAGGWRAAAPLELYVDFETVSTMGDDFSTLPGAGGQALIFQVGMGRWDDVEWVFEQWTCDRLTLADEARMLDAFTGQVDELRRQRGLGWDQLRLVHWWEAEVVAYETGPDSAKARHPGNSWPSLPWFDFLTQVVQPTPVTVTGAFDFGLKSLAKAMHAAGLIETTWDEGPGDGMGAMIGAFWCDREAARVGCSMRDLDVMRGIGKYNEVDCRAMGELVRWLRANR